MFQCPNCAANIKFDIERQKMFCSYCSTEIMPENLSSGSAAYEEEFMDVNVMRCPQCGGDIICDDNEAAAFCSYCGASNMLVSHMEKSVKPRYIIPFKKTKKDCIKNYKRRMRKNIFAPSEMKNVENIDSFRGIYMPYWTYTFAHRGNISMKGTTSKRRGNWEYINHYNLSSNVDVSYAGFHHDASSTFADNLSEAIAPFNERERMDFNQAYMSGFYADISDVDGGVYRYTFNEIVDYNFIHMFKKQKGMWKYNIDSSSTNKSKIKFEKKEMLMLPVWFMSTRIKDRGKERVAYSVVNGQTGKVSGDMPISFMKYTIISVIVSIILFIILNFGMDLTYKPNAALIMANIGCFIMWIIYHVREHSIWKRIDGLDDLGKNNYANRKLVKKTPGEINASLAMKKEKRWRHTYAWIPFAIHMILYYVNPIEDYWYYGNAIISMMFLIYLILITVRDFNKLCTRPLPQFKRSGGDDNATV